MAWTKIASGFLRKREEDNGGKKKLQNFKRLLPNLEANYMYDYNETLDSW